MMRVVLAAAVLLPTLSLADEVWRWRDPSGRLHYSNVRARAPRYAEPVTTEIGHASWPPVSAKTVATRPGPSPQLPREPAASGGRFGLRVARGARTASRGGTPSRRPYIHAPPSIRSTFPVIQAASPDAKKTAARPISYGSPARPSGIVCKT